MTTTFRPLTFNERFFEEMTIVNVPYSLPPEKLPEISTPQVSTLPPTPDLTLSHFNGSNQKSQFGKFVSKNWLPILGVTTGVLLIFLAYKIEQKKKQKNNPMVTTA